MSKRRVTGYLLAKADDISIEDHCNSDLPLRYKIREYFNSFPLSDMEIHF